MKKGLTQDNATVKVYHGYGHQKNLTIYGHVLAGKLTDRTRFSGNPLRNIRHLIKLFLVKPIPFVPLRLQWGTQQLLTTTGKDGFYKFEWASETPVAAGWHPVSVEAINEVGETLTAGTGKVFVSHVTQFAFISDIDDTVLVSHSSSTGKKLRVMFTKNPRSRKTFADVVKYYNLLAHAHTEPDVINPFFYVSSSEWNLYEDLNEFFKHNGLPKGVFLLNQIKKWYQLLKTGRTKHQGKLIRIVRILEAFPKQRFVLLGDNTQKDPEIYTQIALKYPANVVAIYIRNISAKKAWSTQQLLDTVQEKGIHTCLFKHTDEAIEHSRRIGLIG